MSRGLLDDSELREISHETPDLSNLQEMASVFSPDFLSIPFSPESNVPVASVCLKDTVYTLEEARYALHEVFAHEIWYLEKKEPPNNEAAIFFGRFYANDAALRLYSAGEHLANAIIMMLEIGEQDLKPYKKKGISQQVIVGHFLREQKPQHPITEVVIKLADSKEWCDTMRYRNRWVHDQPPTVEGLGVVYVRRRRWETLPTDEGRILRGRSDAPECSIDKLIGFIKPAMFQFSDTLTFVVKFYIDLLKSQGISITFTGSSGTTSIRID